MDLRRRIHSAVPNASTSNSQYGSALRDGQPGRLREIGGTGNASPSTMVATRGLAAQTDSGRRPSLMADSRTRSGQLAIEAGPASARKVDKLRGIASNLVPGPDAPSHTASRSAPTVTTSRPYASSGDQEARNLNPSRSLENGDARLEHNTRSKTILGEQGDMLPEMSDREIIDISDTNTPFHGGSGVRRQTVDGPSRQPQPHSALTMDGPSRKPQPRSALTMDGSSRQPQPRLDSKTTIPSQRRNDAKGLSSNRSSGTTSSTARLPPQNKTTQTIPRPNTAPRGPVRPQAGQSQPISHNRAAENRSERHSNLYLGAFDLEKPEPAAQRPVRSGLQNDLDRISGSSQPATGNHRRDNFNSGSTSSHRSTRRTTVVDHAPDYIHPVDRWAGYNFCGHCGGSNCRWSRPWLHCLPWVPVYVVGLPRQTTFTEISTDYFEEESTSTVSNLDTNKGLAVVNRYYDGWRDAYTDALSGHHDIPDVDRDQIDANRHKLRGRQDEAVRRLRSGDQAVVQETLDQVKMDRQMAVDMPLDQVRWATPWIQEVWSDKHGEIS